jgi:hypothetical protein
MSNTPLTNRVATKAASLCAASAFRSCTKTIQYKKVMSTVVGVLVYVRATSSSCILVISYCKHGVGSKAWVIVYLQLCDAAFSADASLGMLMMTRAQMHLNECK